MTDIPFRRYFVFSILTAFVIGITSGYSIGKNANYSNLMDHYFLLRNDLDSHKQLGGHAVMDNRMKNMETRVSKLEELQ